MACRPLGYPYSHKVLAGFGEGQGGRKSGNKPLD
jgi:hypothetical protein